MKLNNLTDEQIKKLEAARKDGASWSQITALAEKMLGTTLSHDTARQWWLGKDSTLSEPLRCVKKPKEKPAPIPKDDPHIQRLQDEVLRARKNERAAIKRAVAAERLRDIFARSKVDAGPHEKIRPANKKNSAHTAVLVTSDFHFGEVIDADHMNGLNEFNFEIAKLRYESLIRKTVELSFEHLPKNDYDEIVVLRLGDTVAGDIHEELSKTNDLPTLPLCREVAKLEAWGIETLRESFPHVRVISVPGNHGRTTRKPESKLYSDQSYDTLISWMIEDALSRTKGIGFHTPASGDAVFEIYDRRYLATHGDRTGTGGGQGFIGPLAPIVRGMKKLHDTQAAIGQPIDRCFIGHYHTLADVGFGWANGSLPGYSEYGRDGRFRPEPAAQWLINFHPKYGATSQWPIYLSAPPEAK